MRRTTICTIWAVTVLILGPGARAGLVHRYLMEDGEGATVSDSVATNHGTIINSGGGTGSWTTGLFGAAWDGTNSGFISFPSTGLPTNQGTFIQWVKIDLTAGNWSNPLAFHLEDPDYLSPMRHEITSAGYAYLYGVPNGASGNGSATLSTNVVIRDGVWHQWITTYDQAANSTVLYLDGVRVGSTVFNPAGVTVNPTWRLNARLETGASRSRAVYDNTAVYDHVLTPFEMHYLRHVVVDGVTLNNGPPLPDHPTLRHLYAFGQASHPQPNVALDSAAGYHGLVSGGAWVADSPPRGEGGWQKSAAASYVQLPIQANVPAGTFEGWFKTDPSTPDWANPFTTSIRDINEGSSYNAMRVELVPGTTYGPQVSVYGIPGVGSFHVPGLQLADNEWYYLALTYEDGQPVKLYVDGLLAGESTASYDAAMAYDRGFTMLGSRDVGAGESWRGIVGSFAYHAAALPEEVILVHFQTGNLAYIPEPISPLLLLTGGLALALLRRTRPRRTA